MPKSLVFFAGQSNPELAKGIAKELEMPLGKVELKKFSDGENYVNYLETLRGKDVYLFQSTCNPVNDNLMELLIMIDAAKRAAAQRITCIIPFFGYSKQDRKAADREPITAKLVAKLLEAAGADAVITMDLHADQIQGFFDIRADFLYAANTLIGHFKKRKLTNLTVISPDVGATKRSRAYAKRLGAELAIIDKRRPKANHSEVLNLVGDVKGRVCVIVDDEINTGGTLVNAAQKVMDMGAKEVYALASHGVFAGPAIERIDKSPLKEVIVTDSVPMNVKSKKITQVTIAPLLGAAIKCVHENKSISKLLEDTISE